MLMEVLIFTSVSFITSIYHATSSSVLCPLKFQCQSQGLKPRRRSRCRARCRNRERLNEWRRSSKSMDPVSPNFITNSPQEPDRVSMLSQIQKLKNEREEGEIQSQSQVGTSYFREKSLVLIYSYRL